MTERIIDYCRLESGFAAAQRPFALPGDTPHYARDRIVDVRHIKLDISIDPKAKRIEGTAYTTLAPINNGLSHVEFDAVEMEIVSVREGRKKLKYSYDDGKLRIELGGKRKAGAEITVAVEYAAYPRRGLYFVAPDKGYPKKPVQVWSQGQDEDSRHWYPCFDFPNEMATSEMIVSVPKPLTAVSNGELLDVREEGRRRTFHFRQDVPHVAYLLSVAAADFAEITKRVDGVELQYWVEQGREDEARRALGRTPEMVRFFSDVTGVPYPYAKYAQVCVNDFIFGGMENVSATTLTDTCLFDKKAEQDAADNTDGLVAHELAHQWFGDLLTCRDWAHGWLNEGFATYFDELFCEHKRGVDAFRYEMRVNADIYMREDSSRYRRPIVSNTYNEPIDLFDRQFYEKGGWVLHMLRFELGDELFWKANRHYTEKHKHTNVTTPDLQRAIEEATGRNMDQFFEQWVYGAGHPQLNVSWEWDESAKQAKVTVKQTQSKEHDTAEVFHSPVVVDFVFAKGHQDFRVRLAEREQSFYFPLAEKPKMMRFDPGGWLLKTLEYKRGAEQLIYALQHDEDVLGRIDAAKELGKQATKEAVAALKAAVLKDKFFGVQTEAAKALGAIGIETALDALLACTKVEASRARRGVMAALGTFRDEAPDNRGDRAAAALEQVIARGDKSYYVEAEAVASMGRTRSKRAFAALKSALKTDSHNNVIRMRAFEGFGELRDERALPLAIEWSRYGKPMQARMGAIGCLGRLGNYVEKKDPVRDRLVELLDDVDLRVRMAAVGALVDLRDDKAVGALEGLAARELDGRVIRGARTAAARLREGHDKGEEVKKLREDLDKMRQEHKTLKDRLEKLDAPKGGASRNGAKASSQSKVVAARKKPQAKRGARANSRARRRR